MGSSIPTSASERKFAASRSFSNAAIRQRAFSAISGKSSKVCAPCAPRERGKEVSAGQIFLLVCGAVLACGFVYAAGQKFAAVQYGYRYEALRQEKERLLAERERLQLELDKAASPARLENAAKTNGLEAARVAQIQALKTGAAREFKPRGASSDETAKQHKTSVLKTAHAKL